MTWVVFERTQGCSWEGEIEQDWPRGGEAGERHAAVSKACLDRAVTVALSVLGCSMTTDVPEKDAVLKAEFVPVMMQDHGASYPEWVLHFLYQDDSGCLHTCLVCAL